MPLMVDGELLQDDEVRKLMALVENDAKKVAGEFHGMKRSAKFRAMWPNEYVFAEQNWKNFVVAVRMMYAERLADQKTRPEEAETMFRALCVQAMMGAGPNAPAPIQSLPNTENFVGDKTENKVIDESFGVGQGPGSLKSRMLRTAGRRLN
ncbi:MAG TPA: hypothetical protein VKX28_26900 [Xanthobacteraceae bacterium]|nr:hypothetical protein [Xanthobacteraceae bacterium]